MSELENNVNVSWQLVAQFVSWEFCRYMCEQAEKENDEMESDVLTFLRDMIVKKTEKAASDITKQEIVAKFVMELRTIQKHERMPYIQELAKTTVKICPDLKDLVEKLLPTIDGLLLILKMNEDTENKLHILFGIVTAVHDFTKEAFKVLPLPELPQMLDPWLHSEPQDLPKQKNETEIICERAVHCLQSEKITSSEVTYIAKAVYEDSELEKLFLNLSDTETDFESQPKSKFLSMLGKSHLQSKSEASPSKTVSESPVASDNSPKAREPFWCNSFGFSMDVGKGPVSDSDSSPIYTATQRRNLRKNKELRAVVDSPVKSPSDSSPMLTQRRKSKELPVSVSPLKSPSDSSHLLSFNQQRKSKELPAAVSPVKSSSDSSPLLSFQRRKSKELPAAVSPVKYPSNLLKVIQRRKNKELPTIVDSPVKSPSDSSPILKVTQQRRNKELPAAIPPSQPRPTSRTLPPVIPSDSDSSPDLTFEENREFRKKTGGNTEGRISSAKLNNPKVLDASREELFDFDSENDDVLPAKSTSYNKNNPCASTSNSTDIRDKNRKKYLGFIQCVEDSSVKDTQSTLASSCFDLPLSQLLQTDTYDENSGDSSDCDKHGDIKFLTPTMYKKDYEPPTPNNPRQSANEDPFDPSSHSSSSRDDSSFRPSKAASKPPESPPKKRANPKRTQKKQLQSSKEPKISRQMTLRGFGFSSPESKEKPKDKSTARKRPFKLFDNDLVPQNLDESALFEKKEKKNIKKLESIGNKKKCPECHQKFKTTLLLKKHVFMFHTSEVI